MMKTRNWLVMALAAFLIASVAPAAEELPEESETLLRNLEQWEFVEKAHLEEKLKEKRRQVVETLRRHQASHTRLGDLDTALAIKKRADALEALIPQPPGGMVFQFPWDEGPGEVQVLFHKDGTATYTNLGTGQGFEKGFRWAEKSPGVVDLWYHTRKAGEGMRWVFDRAYRSAKVDFDRKDLKFEAKRVEASGPKP